MSEFVTAAVVAGAVMGLGWLASLRLRDASIVDPLWPTAFVALAWAVWGVHRDGFAEGRAWLILGMVTVWGARLALHLAARKWGEPEDYRYAAMRRRRQRFGLWSLPMVFGLQAALVAVVSLPVQAAIGTSGGFWRIGRGGGETGHTTVAGGGFADLGVLQWVGCAVWAVGFVFESVADHQLRRFRAGDANRAAVLDTGLWRYSRHPNYFGDCLVWWGIYLAAATTPWWTVVGPILMTVLLVRVSGVRLLERTIGERRPGYADYVRRTSAFIPRPPRR